MLDLLSAGLGAGRAMGLALSLMVLSVCCGARAQGTVAAGSEPGAASTGVRIVRLSTVRGHVELDRGTGRGFEAGFTNLPVVQGNRLRTQGLGWAEVEFEDGGSLRITPNTQVDFTALARGSDGRLQSALSMKQGTLYVSRMKGDKSDLMVVAGGNKLILPPNSHIRLDVYPAGSDLVVVKGSVRVEDENGVATVADRNHALKFGGGPGVQLVQAKNEAPGLYDRWDAESVAYHQALGGGGAYSNGSGNLSGVRDLQYYGGFANLDGCGRVWQPYLASAAFDPAASGAWAWYPGAGYTFVSPYLWGWTTFNSGSWVSCGTQGWGWRPGAWVGMKNRGIVEPIHGPGHRPRPVDEPVAGKPTVVDAGDHGMVRSRVMLDGSSKFERDSAGLGVPRGSVDNLKEISKAVGAGRAAPAPAYAGDLVAADPMTLNIVARGSGLSSRDGAIVGVRGMELAGVNSRPVAPPVVSGGHGGYSGAAAGFGGSGARSGGVSFSSGGARSGGSGAFTSSSGGPAPSASGASVGSSAGSSGGGAHH
jgi:hypothetical protein